MTAVKRRHEEVTQGEKSSDSPFLPMFEQFREELNEHHDRRERIIKASRDITALSKKMIFSLQRVRTVKGEIPSKIAAELDERSGNIVKLFESVSPDLQGLNSWRYQRQISPGIQEYIEAVSFKFYLQNQGLIAPQQVLVGLKGNSEAKISVTFDDYILGIFDLVGEMMRFAITAMATSGTLPGSPGALSTEERTILMDLRLLRTHFETLDTTSSRGAGLGKDVEKKMEVMRTCVEKVETSVYGLIIRGRERPVGWMPSDVTSDRPAKEEY